MYYIYRIYYNNEIVYVGRTNNINNRIRQHITSGKLIDVKQISKIEIALLDTEADMNLYELYYILKLKPILNSKDTTKDELTIDLPELNFNLFQPHLYEKWKQRAIDKQLNLIETQQKLNQIKIQLSSNTVSNLEQEILPYQYQLLKSQL